MKPISSLYIHFPWCVRKCPYCDFNSYAVSSLPKNETEYITALKKNFYQMINKWTNINLKTIYLGGGTPSLFSADKINEIISFVKDNVPVSDDAEISMEINPGTVNYEKLKLLRTSVNRISFGVQSFSDKSLNILKRIHNSKQAYNNILAAQDAGFENINIDLIHDLPLQTASEAIQDLDIAIKLNVPHLSWYQLTIEEGTEFANYDNLEIADEDEQEIIEQQGKQILSENGYHNYEISGFAKNKNYCKHNLTYWNYEDYLGIGAGAHGKITDWENKKIFRTAQIENPKDYMEINDFLSSIKKVETEVIPFEFFINHARLYDHPILTKTYEEQTFLNLGIIRNKLDKAQHLGLINYDQDEILITDFGRKYLNQFLELFL